MFDIMQAKIHIIRCLQGERRPLQFIVDWPMDDKSQDFVGKAVANRTFLTKWKNMLYSASGMKPYSLRITKLYAMLKLMAVKHSLELQVKTDFTEHTTPSMPTQGTKGTTKIPFSLRPDPEDETTSSYRSTVTQIPRGTTTTQKPGGSTTTQKPGGSTTPQKPVDPALRPRWFHDHS
ncbi:hypothetical protein HNY73_013891 [Argiope bruennichi]|uniref:Uncharacterized protein n=1 Tax=Argiope bruennichi TaxID=94029 RepID=A0A8T0ESH3_ARGBR|nr:hypothetical protein HNY73_013891 [Argiope bruennichi]